MASLPQACPGPERGQAGAGSPLATPGTDVARISTAMKSVLTLNISGLRCHKLATFASMLPTGGVHWGYEHAATVEVRDFEAKKATYLNEDMREVLRHLPLS